MSRPVFRLSSLGYCRNFVEEDLWRLYIYKRLILKKKMFTPMKSQLCTIYVISVLYLINSVRTALIEKFYPDRGKANVYLFVCGINGSDALLNFYCFLSMLSLCLFFVLLLLFCPGCWKRGTQKVPRSRNRE